MKGKITVFICTLLYFTITASLIKGNAAEHSDFVIENGVLMQYTGTDTEVRIPDNVTKIKESTFLGNTTITSVVIPNSVVEIERSAFAECKNLVEVVLPDSLSVIPENGFENCEQLCTINLGKVEEIHTSAFAGCKKLLSADLTSVKILESMAFFNSGLTVFTGLDQLEYADGDALGSTVYSELFGLNWDENRMLIKNGILLMTANCTGTVYIPSTVTEIASDAFHYQDMTAVMIPSSVKKIGNSAFVGCSDLKTVRMEDSVTEIGDSAFEGCYNLSQLRLSNQLTSLPSGVIFRCNKLKCLTLPHELIEMEYPAPNKLEALVVPPTFLDATKLKQLINPNSTIYSTVIKQDAELSAFLKENNITLKELELNATAVTLTAGKKYALRFDNGGYKNTVKADWSSSNQTVATVNAMGDITAKKKGTATITATIYGKEYTCKVTVK